MACENGMPQTKEEFEKVLLQLDTIRILFSVCTILGAIGSTIPQHIKLWKTKTSAGVSFWWLFIGSIGLFSSCLNAVILKAPQEVACSKLGLLKCMPSLLSLLQVAGIFVFTIPIYVWCLYFIDPAMPQREKKIAKILFIIIILYCILATTVASFILGLNGACSYAAKGFAEALGIFAAFLTLVHWAPQIYATYKRKSVGSFSILMLLMQCPGALILVFSLVVVSKEQVTTWLPFFCSAVQQGVLLALCLYYHFKAKREAKIKALDEIVLLENAEDNDKL